MFNVGDKVQLSDWCIRRTATSNDYVREFQNFAKSNRGTVFTIKEVCDDGTFRINIGSGKPNCHEDGWWLEEQEMTRARDTLPEELFEL